MLVHPRCFSDNAELPLLFSFIWRLAISGAAAPSNSIEDCLDTCTSTTLVSHHTRIATEETELLGRPRLRGGEIWQERQSRNLKGESGPRKHLTYFNHHRLVSGKISGRSEGITRISKICYNTISIWTFRGQLDASAKTRQIYGQERNKQIFK